MKKGLKSVIGEVDINRDLVLLLTIGGLYSISIFLSNTFVNIFLWKQAGDYATIAFYNLAVYILQPFTFILAGKWAKKVDRVIVLRLGVSFLSLFFMTVLILGENAAKYNILLGAILGVGYGFYWLAFNVLTFEITEPETRDFFNGFFGLLQSFGGMIGPITAGFIISKMEAYTGYTTIFSISLTLFVVAVVCSLFLNRRSAEGDFRFVRIFQERKNSKNWRRVLQANYSQGIREGTFLFVISIWVFLITESELSLGTFNLVFSAFSFVCYYLATRFIKPVNRKKAIFIGGSILYFSIYLIIFFKSFTILLIYAAIIGIAYPIIYVPYFSLAYDVIGTSWKAKEMRIEYIVVKELFLNGGRVSSILLFIIVTTLFDTEKSIPYLLAIVGIGHFLIYFFMRDVEFVPHDKKETKKSEPIITKEVIEEENR
ncbi:YQGE family putative transporter [Salirhabdus euzebyi]|uniref:YQGE family putative transporter n=1 Tax=Salirhabdus euzebyi TaxID=394506 RepID=A0A841Q7D2_9BACI|nr:MFS transporter [Salirhabdus euzebyi]MBB6454285.1 YQGE family putative transporter [Salirhabdus euzebyi]